MNGKIYALCVASAFAVAVAFSFQKSNEERQAAYRERLAQFNAQPEIEDKKRRAVESIIADDDERGLSVGWYRDRFVLNVGYGFYSGGGNYSLYIMCYHVNKNKIKLAKTEVRFNDSVIGLSDCDTNQILKNERPRL